mmetsp:Transcript_9481/g.38971  ORF Transcript_9481/g.38971 Transcript_9481/m.38971 type:complete len:232 (-) Transcript_9481:861-1556(-)
MSPSAVRRANAHAVTQLAPSRNFSASPSISAALLTAHKARRLPSLSGMALHDRRSLLNSGNCSGASTWRTCLAAHVMSSPRAATNALLPMSESDAVNAGRAYSVMLARLASASSPWAPAYRSASLGERRQPRQNCPTKLHAEASSAWGGVSGGTRPSAALSRAGAPPPAVADTTAARVRTAVGCDSRGSAFARESARPCFSQSLARAFSARRMTRGSAAAAALSESHSPGE